jgi:hypothetical protein
VSIDDYKSGTQASVTSETSVLTSPPSTDDGIYQFLVDVADMVEDDDVVVRVKEKCRAGDTQRTVWGPGLTQQAGDEPLLFVPSLLLLHGWDLTLQALVGTVSFDYRIDRVTTGISEHDSGSQTASIDTEHVLGTTTDTTVGIYQLFIDTANMTETDIVRVRLRETAKSGGTKRNGPQFWVANGPGDGMWVSPAFILRYGWDWTLMQDTGTGRAFPWSIRKAA